MQALEDGVVVQGAAVPHVNLRVIGHLPRRDQVPRLIRDRETDHFGVMLQVEPLHVKASVVEDDDASREIGDLLAVQDGLFLVLFTAAGRESLWAADNILNGAFRVPTADPIDPFQLAADLLRLLQIVLVQGFTVQTVGDDGLKGRVKPPTEVRRTLVIDQLSSILSDEGF